MENEWIFTFGCGQKYAGKCVRITGTFNEARQKMCSKFEDKWAFQYSSEEWEKMKNDPNRAYNMEEEIDMEEL